MPFFVASPFDALFFIVFSDTESGFFEDQNFLFSACIQNDVVFRNTHHPFPKREITFHEIFSTDRDDAFAFNIEDRL